MRNPQLFARIFNTPLMIHPCKLDAIIGGIGQRFGIQSDNVVADMAMLSKGDYKKPGYEVIDGIAVIDVFGVLSHRGGFQADSSYILGYDAIGNQIQTALNDSDVDGILLQMDSPGGESAGSFELAVQLRAWGDIKPIWSVISSLSASANYLLSSATSQIGISETGRAGSVGVVMRHVDVSKMAKKGGVTVTHIFAGSKKIDGNQFQPLSDKVKSSYQSEINNIYNLFVNRVSEYRSLSADIIREHQSGVFTGQDAITAGLADCISTPDQMLTDMQKTFSKSNRSFPMSKTSEQGSDNSEAQDESLVTALEEGKNQGVVLERARIKSILGHESASGREAQAKALALETDLGLEAAIKVLDVSPKEAMAAKDQSKDQFSMHMGKLGNPAVGADAGDDEGEGDSDEKALSLILGGLS